MGGGRRSSPGPGKLGTWRRTPTCPRRRCGTWRSLVNIGASWRCLETAELRVHAMQTKLHQWAISEPDRCFDDLFNLVHDPAFLVVAWSRVRRNKGGRTAGVDGIAPRS